MRNYFLSHMTKRVPVRSIFCILVFLLLSVALSGCTSLNYGSLNRSIQNTDASPAITINDSYGERVTLPHTADRIVCQNGMAAELLIAIGAGDRIVGLADATMKNSYIVNQTPNARSIGNTMTPDIETLITLQPDVLIFYGYKKPTNLDKVLGTNITLLYTKGYELEELPGEARMFGKITGKEDRAERYARFTEHYTNLVKERLANISDTERPDVYLESWTDYTVMAPDSSAHNLITLLHARNVAENISQSGKISPEWVVDQNPDVIFKLVTAGEDARAVRESVMNRSGSRDIRAVREDRVYTLYTDTMSSPHAVAGFVYMAKALYPDRFTDLDPEDVLREYADEFLPGSDLGGAFYPRLPENYTHTTR